MENDALYIYLFLMLLIWLFGGFFLIYLAWIRKRVVECTLGASYKSVLMEVLDINLVPNYLYGGVGIYPLNERNSFVLIKYKYIWDGKIYESRRIFPLEIEWMEPRISSFSLFSDLKEKRLNRCFVNSLNPSQAVLFRGWSSYLKKHISSIFISGFLVVVVGILIWWKFL